MSLLDYKKAYNNYSIKRVSISFGTDTVCIDYKVNDQISPKTFSFFFSLNCKMRDIKLLISYTEEPEL